MDGLNAFTTFLDTHGPYDIVIDGANVVLHHNTSRKTNVICIHLLHTLIVVLSYLHPRARILTVMHVNPKGVTLAGPEAAYLAGLEATGQLYFVPKYCDDDWFWMWAGLHGGEDTMVVTNDLMRNQKFLLGGSRNAGTLVDSPYYSFWSTHHVLRYSFATSADRGRSVLAHVHYPLPFTYCS